MPLSRTAPGLHPVARIRYAAALIPGLPGQAETQARRPDCGDTVEERPEVSGSAAKQALKPLNQLSFIFLRKNPVLLASTAGIG
jgi:hypothetical protein